MRQLDLSSVTHNDTEKIIPTNEPLKKPPLPQIDLKCNIEKDVIPQSNENGGIEANVVVNENGELTSARSSRSSSLNSNDNKMSSVNRPLNGGGPAYERRLLKKKLTVPEISFDDFSVDDYHVDDETRNRILDYKSDAEKYSVGVVRHRKYSFNDKLRHLVDVATHHNHHKDQPTMTTTAPSNKEKAAAAVKKLIKSPSLLRKSPSFSKTTDSCVSSSTENEQREKRKKRKISLGKRTRKSSKGPIEKPKEPDDEKEISSKPERTTKFRRRKLVKSQSESSLAMYNVSKSKMILLYSGDSPAKRNNSTSHSNRNRVDILRKESMDSRSSSEYEECSSALSDFETVHNSGTKSRKVRSNFAKRVWKSINSLLFDEQSSPPQTKHLNTPPSIRRRHSTKSYKKSRSMPTGLNRIKSFSGRKTSLLRGDDTIRDDFTLMKKKNSLDMSMKFLGVPSRSCSKEHVDIKNSKRSKSMDFLNDHSLLRSKSSDMLFEKRKKAHSTITSREHRKNVCKQGLHYKIIVSHAPIADYQNIEEALELPELTNTDEHEMPSTPILQSKMKTGQERRKDYVKVRLQDMKATCQRELETFLVGKEYHAENVNQWCRTLSESIQSRIVQITEDNYKIVAQVFIGALFDDGIHAAVQCTTSNNNDNFFTVTFKGKDMFVVASVMTFEISPLDTGNSSL
ncbi:transcriptional regulator ATRX homolog [Clytia hemisphaerica]|uniref:Uncharacterized protein n=1 Tax=Clytia hemisphaerica TaxID=252671 RepID=A0A7M5WX05_9CNID|eukprot:TCONS_00059168-protein